MGRGGLSQRQSEDLHSRPFLRPSSAGVLAAGLETLRLMGLVAAPRALTVEWCTQTRKRGLQSGTVAGAVRGCTARPLPAAGSPVCLALGCGCPHAEQSCWTARVPAAAVRKGLKGSEWQGFHCPPAPRPAPRRERTTDFCGIWIQLSSNCCTKTIPNLIYPLPSQMWCLWMIKYPGSGRSTYK